MKYQSGFIEPPRMANRLVNLFAAAEGAESLQGDMLEEFSQLASKSEVAFARSWYWRQTWKTIAHLIGTAFRTAPLLTAATVIGGFILNRLVSGLPERAIFAALHRYQVFDHSFTSICSLRLTALSSAMSPHHFSLDAPLQWPPKAGRWWLR